jgi:hypothetical protein
MFSEQRQCLFPHTQQEVKKCLIPVRLLVRTRSWKRELSDRKRTDALKKTAGVGQPIFVMNNPSNNGNQHPKRAIDWRITTLPCQQAP